MSIRKDRTEIRQRASHLIREARKKENFSQSQLAVALSVSQPLVSSWECGKVTPGIDDLVAIESALAMPEGSLILAIAYPSVAGSE